MREPKGWVVIFATSVWLFFAAVLIALQFTGLALPERLSLGVVVSLFLLWLALVAPPKTRCAAILAFTRARR